MTEPPATTNHEPGPPGLLDTRVRGYLVTLLASLGIIFVALFQNGQLTAAVLPMVFAACGLLLGWTLMPPLVIASVCYLLVFPAGVPDRSSWYADVRSSYFRLTDLLFVPALLCYAASQYRIYGLTHAAVPDDRPRRHTVKPAEPSPYRPGDDIPDGELQGLIVGAVLAVLAGQLFWLAVTKLDFSPTRFPPVWVPPRGISSTSGQFVLFVLAFGGGAAVIRFAFWYWRLKRLSPDEARLLLTDTLWREIRRESARLETWRAWGRPFARSGKRPSFWAEMGTPLVVVLSLVVIGVVGYMIWVSFR